MIRGIESNGKFEEGGGRRVQCISRWRNWRFHVTQMDDVISQHWKMSNQDEVFSYSSFIRLRWRVVPYSYMY